MLHCLNTQWLSILLSVSEAKAFYSACPMSRDDNDTAARRAGQQAQPVSTFQRLATERNVVVVKTMREVMVMLVGVMGLLVFHSTCSAYERSINL